MLYEYAYNERVKNGTIIPKENDIFDIKSLVSGICMIIIEKINSVTYATIIETVTIVFTQLPKRVL